MRGFWGFALRNMEPASGREDVPTCLNFIASVHCRLAPHWVHESMPLESLGGATNRGLSSLITRE